MIIAIGLIITGWFTVFMLCCYWLNLKMGRYWWLVLAGFGLFDFIGHLLKLFK